MREAKDLMTKEPICIPSGTKLADAMNVFIEQRMTSAPVITPAGDIIGLLTELNLMRAFLIKQLKDNKNDKVFQHKDLLIPASFVHEDASVVEVVSAILKSSVHRVLVQNRASRLVGIVSPKDVLAFLAGEEKHNFNLVQKLSDSQAEIEKLSDELQGTKSVLDQYMRLYEDSPIMMHSADKDGRVIMANKRIHQLLGYDPHELIGKTIFDLYTKSCHAEAVSGLKKIQQAGKHHSIYSTMVKKNGEKLRVEVVSSALLGKHKEFIGTISVSREVDSELLLRALHGVLNSDTLSDAETASLKEKILNESQAWIDDSQAGQNEE